MDYSKNEKKKILYERIAQKEMARQRGDEDEENKAEESPERPKKKKDVLAAQPGAVAEKPKKKKVLA